MFTPVERENSIWNKIDENDLFIHNMWEVILGVVQCK